MTAKAATDLTDDEPASQRISGLRQGLSLLGRYARPHLPVIALGVLLGLVMTGATLAIPMVAKWVLDSLGTDTELAGPVGVLLALLVVGAVAGFAQSVLLGRLAERVVFDARRLLIDRFFRARLLQVQQFKIGELVTRVTSDTVLLREAATSSVVQLINGTISLVGTIALMAVLDWSLLLTTLLGLAVVGAVIGILLPHIGKASKRAQDAIGELGASLEGGLRALRTVKSSRAESREIGRVVDKAQESARHSMRSVWYSALTWAIAGGGMQISLVVVLGLGAWQVSLGALEVSTLVAFLLYAFNVIDPITTIAGACASVQAGLAAARRIEETAHLDLEDTSLRSVGDPGPQPGGDTPVLALRGVSAGYGAHSPPALREVSLEIPRTGHVALVGPSGAGKTTVFSLMLRFIDAREGRLELDGTPYSHLSIDDVRSRIAYVEQETPVVPGSVRENVLFRVDGASDDEAWDALAAVRLDEKVRSLPRELDTPVADTSLSGGERQRLAVARALVRRPAILLLDEATAQLDGTTEAAVQAVITDAARFGAVVTIAHRLSTILDADQIVVLDRGRIRSSGTHMELLDRDELYRQFIDALRIQTSPDGRPPMPTGPLRSGLPLA